MIRYLRRRRLDREIESLRERLAMTDREREPLAAARLCHDLAQLCVMDGRRRDAVRWFGQSIDAYIYAGFTEAAAAMCNRLLRLEPAAVRARATLAMLHLANQRVDDAIAEITHYVAATRALGERAEITEERLRLIGSLADDDAVITLIGQSLLELGAGEAGHELLRRVAERDRCDPGSTLSAQERWRRLLEAAVQPTDTVVPAARQEPDAHFLDGSLAGGRHDRSR